MTSFTEIAARIISDLAEAATSDDGELLQSVRRFAKPHLAELESLVSLNNSRMKAHSATKEECDLIREEGTRVFQV